ncbi:MAG: c-type cytochrome domain-containing protein [Pirellulaceae bacterium]
MISREVLPLLSNKCFVCHGPDTADESSLRLDSFESATADRGGYQAVRAGRAFAQQADRADS